MKNRQKFLMFFVSLFLFTLINSTRINADAYDNTSTLMYVNIEAGPGLVDPNIPHGGKGEKEDNSKPLSPLPATGIPTNDSLYLFGFVLMFTGTLLVISTKEGEN